MNHNAGIRPPAVAGLFYPDQKIELDRQIAIYLENAPDVTIPGRIFGIVAPHAGYMYSGGVAAHAYRQIVDADIDTVAVISPSHREYFTEISVYDGSAYTTPLGNVPVAHDLAVELAGFNPQIILSEKGHRFEEHALEVQLPFLQNALEDFRLLPVVMGEHSHDNIETLAAGLGSVLKDRKALVVASSDLSHFYTAGKAETLDHQVSELVNAYDAERGDIQILLSGAAEETTPENSLKPNLFDAVAIASSVAEKVSEAITRQRSTVREIDRIPALRFICVTSCFGHVVKWRIIKFLSGNKPQGEISSRKL